MAVASGNPYGGGEIGLFPPAGGGIVQGPSHSFDAAFDAGFVFGSLPSILQFYVAPSNAVFVGTTVTFTASASGQPPLYAQWQYNGGAGLTNIQGATSNTLTLYAEVTNSGSYDFVLSNVYGAVTSAPIELTVTHDTNPPTVLSYSIIGLSNVAVEFSKLLNAATATNTSNYVFTNGLAVTGAVLETNNTVLLTIPPLVYGSNYSILINGVFDQAIPPNSIATNTPIRFTPSPWNSQDIGNPSVHSTFAVTSPNGINVTSDGSSLGGSTDQCNFQYQPRTGNFDVVVRVSALGLSSIWAQAGLMARETLGAGTPMAAAVATPGINGDSFIARTATGAGALSSGSFPANYPNTWLRLNRVRQCVHGLWELRRD